MAGISRSRGWDKEIPHGVLPMEQLVLSDKWARKGYLRFYPGIENHILPRLSYPGRQVTSSCEIAS